MHKACIIIYFACYKCNTGGVGNDMVTCTHGDGEGVKLDAEGWGGQGGIGTKCVGD